MKKDSIISLSGKWDMKYLSEERYTDKAEPSMDGAFSVECAVPNYFEDMRDIFVAAGIEKDNKIL